MPYVKQEDRDVLDPPIHLLAKTLNANYATGRALAGPLNYAITRLILDTLPQTTTYSRLALITGVLENVKQELYRRVASPYEDSKAQENGDVYR